MTCIPSLPPAHAPCMLAPCCASSASSSYVGTYGGLKIRMSTACFSRRMSGAARGALIASIGIYCTLTERPLPEGSGVGHTLFCLPVSLVHWQAWGFISVVMYTEQINLVTRHEGQPKRVLHVVEAPSMLPTKLDTQPEPEL